ncbi:MAG: hypothetical protein CML73_05730 [Rhodobiaceae bacterium]|nr:hypothetical protein [Rhodobiaceae bacterium]
MNTFDYLKSEDGRVHLINVKKKGGFLKVGILCTIAQDERKCRIANENISFLVELPEGTFSKGARAKVFNVDLTILKDEQIQLPSPN